MKLTEWCSTIKTCRQQKKTSCRLKECLVLGLERRQVIVYICSLNLRRSREKLGGANNALREFARGNRNKYNNKFKRDEQVLYLSNARGYCVANRVKIVKRNSTHTFWIEVEGVIRTAHANQ